MKKKYLILIFTFILLACTDLLEEDNKSNKNSASEEYYSTSEGYETLVNACYASLKEIWGNVPSLFSFGTDLYETGKNPSSPGLNTYQELKSTDQDVLNFYRRCYSGIQKCNIALYYGDHTEETKALTRLKAEAKFIRALYYFELLQQFGGVPIVEEMITSPKTSFERSTKTELYDFIIYELESLLSVNLPEKSIGDEFGRVDKRTVNHYLSKIHLCKGWDIEVGTSQDFDKAITYGKTAIGDDKLTLPFRDVFDFNNQENSEIIFSVQYDRVSMISTTSDGNAQSVMFSTEFDPPLKGKNPARNGALITNKRTFELFEEGDERYDATFLSVIHTYHFDYYNYTSEELAEKEITYYYPPHWATTDDDILAWRMEDPEHRMNTNVKKFDNKMFNDVQNYARAQIIKFDDPTAEVNGTKVSTRDVILARLAETYLNVAEAYFKKDEDGSNAVIYLNEVRNRAKVPPASASDITIDYILEERAREMVGEYCRWKDLKRTGKLKEYTFLYNSNIKALVDLGIDPFKGSDGNDKILRPIPSAAIDANKAEIIQNPGY